mmetsp:Transcript_122870/g.393595  ORF Transcript_122870/g.393595 Transcript_122870/m.393595 type:complete len:483 (-) Transcript_122870:107-1555(-)
MSPMSRLQRRRATLLALAAAGAPVALVTRRFDADLGAGLAGSVDAGASGSLAFLTPRPRRHLPAQPSPVRAFGRCRLASSGPGGSAGGTDNDAGGTGTGRRAAFTELAQEAVMGAAELAAKVLAFAAAFYGGAKISVIGQPRLPPLTGAFASVGSRVDIVAGLRCRTFYPSAARLGGAVAEAPYLTEGTGTSDAMAKLVFFPGFLLEHLGFASSGCAAEGAPLLPQPGAAGYPVLVYSHGQGGNMDMGAYFLRQIASHGVIVVAVEHRDGSASTADPSNPRPFNLMKGQLGVQLRAAELVEVATALSTQDGMAATLGGDPSRLLVGGHSYGGPTALLAACMRPQLFQGLILHDPALSSGLPKPPQPVFSVVGDQYAGIQGLAREVRTVSGPAGNVAAPGGPWAGAWQYVGVSHGNFVDAPLWAPLPIMRLLGLLLIPAAGPEEPADAHSRLAEAAASFAEACCGRRSEGSSPVQPSAPFQPL